MHQNYAFLWVLLLVQGNEIRFYRGMKLGFIEERYYNFFRKAKNSQKNTCSGPDRFYLAFVFHQASQSYIVFLKYATITRNNQLFFGEKTLVLCRCRTSLKAIAPKYHPFASHPCQPKNGTYLGLTWDLLGTYLGLTCLCARTE